MKTWGKKYILEEKKGNAKALRSQRKLLILMIQKNGPCAFSKSSKAVTEDEVGVLGKTCGGASYVCAESLSRVQLL